MHRPGLHLGIAALAAIAMLPATADEEMRVVVRDPVGPPPEPRRVPVRDPAPLGGRTYKPNGKRETERRRRQLAKRSEFGERT